MKIKSTLACVASIMLALPAIAEESTLRAIIGKNLTNRDVSRSVIHPDGTLEGVYKGTPYSGTWEERDGMYCRVIPAFNANGCQTVVAILNSAGDMVAVEFRNNGADTGNRYDIN